MGQKDGEKWTAAVDSQPTLPKSDRLPGCERYQGLRRVLAQQVPVVLLDHQQARSRQLRHGEGVELVQGEMSMSRGFNR